MNLAYEAAGRGARAAKAAAVALAAARRDAAESLTFVFAEELPAAWSRLRRILSGRARARRGRLRGRRLAPLVVGLALLAWLLPGPVLRLAALPLDARLPPLPQRSLVLAADGTPLAVLHRGADRRVVSLREMPPLLRRLAVLSEDRRFWEHDGYDMAAMLRALGANLRAGAVVQGGSTITQQLAKQNFTNGDRSLARKAREVVYAVALERRFSKEELLERYLNQVYFGSGAYGVAAAAEEYFGVAAAELSASEAALLVGLIRSPVTLDPRQDPGEARRLRNVVLEVAADDGALERARAERLQRRPLGLVPPSHDGWPPVVDAVVRSFLANPAFGESREKRVRLLFSGGLRIVTTIHPRLQQAAERLVSTHHAAGAPAAALAAVEPATGAVRALAGAGPPGVASLDLAAQSRRQPGSALKPFVAVAALEAGLWRWQRLAGDSPTAFRYGDRWWPVENYGDDDLGAVDLREALVYSVNTAFAQLGVALGPDTLAGVLSRVGIDVDEALGPPGVRGPSIALGGLHRGVSPLELAAAYGIFATNGVYAEPALITRVTDSRGEDVHRHRPQRRRATSAEVANTVRELLQEVVDDGTGRPAALPTVDAAGKTGTTQRAADAWFAGVVPDLAAAVWVGHPAGAVAMPGATGARLAAPVWRPFMSAALGVLPGSAFPPAPPAATGQDRLDLPRAWRCTERRCGDP